MTLKGDEQRRGQKAKQEAVGKRAADQTHGRVKKASTSWEVSSGISSMGKWPT